MKGLWPKGLWPRGHRIRTRPFLVVVSAVGLIIGLSAGAAYAYFTSSGSGGGSASVGSLQTVTLVAATGKLANLLLPGGTGDVTLNVNNPNGFPVTLLSVTSSGTVTADAGHPGCTAPGVTFTSQTGLNLTIPASTTISVDLPKAASMDATSSSGCQGATFSIPVTITVQK